METRPLNAFTDHPKNVDLYGDEDIDEDLVASIREHGLFEPLLVTPENTILSGHRRAAAAREAGLEEVPVIERDVDGELDALEVIVHSNQQRRKTNWQLAKEADALIYIERERARERMSQGGQGGIEGKEHVPDLGQARDIVGGKLGVSGRQVTKVLDIVEAVEALQDDGDHDTAAEVREALNNRSVAAAHRHEAVQEHKAKHRKKPEQEAPSSYVTLSEWKEMSEDERQVVLARPGGTTTFNKQTNASIEWAQWSWNPVTGCLHNCPYCYARDLAHRYLDQGFAPCFLPERLAMPANTRMPERAAEEIGFKNVFTCSMADLFGKWVPQEWIDAVLGVMREQDQWNYLMLTKFPKRLADQDWPENAWVGASVDRQADVQRTMKAFRRIKEKSNAAITWLSLEPLLEPLAFESLSMFDMVVIGGASPSSKTPKWIPPPSWYEQILWQAREDNCAVYVKDNLEYRPREYPGVKPREEERAPEVFFLPGRTVGV